MRVRWVVQKKRGDRKQGKKGKGPDKTENVFGRIQGYFNPESLDVKHSCDILRQRH